LSASKRQVGGNHYSDMKIGVSEFVVANKVGWLEANVIKYVCRHSQKGGAMDIDKAKHYLDLILEAHYPNE